MHTIRRAETGDIPGILKLLVQVNMVHHTIRPDLFNSPATKYTEDELKALLKDENKPVFVCADENGQVLAHCFCCFKQQKGHNILTDVKTLYIDDLCVDEAHRGQHIGKAMYDFVLAFAKASGCYSVTLNVWAGNDSAKQFYDNCGMACRKYEMELIL